MPARAIIALQRSAEPDGRIRFAYVVRADVPVSRRPFVLDAINASPILYISPFRPIPPDTDPDTTAIATGAVVERLDSVLVGGGLTLPEVQALLERLQADYQAAVTADKTYVRYGSYFNGTAWIVQGSA